MNSNWISVKDKYPEVGKPVLAYCQEPGSSVGYIAALTYLGSDERGTKPMYVPCQIAGVPQPDEEIISAYRQRMTHWMSLPESPERMTT